jgi:hypothetical protein
MKPKIDIDRLDSFDKSLGTSGGGQIVNACYALEQAAVRLAEANDQLTKAQCELVFSANMAAKAKEDYAAALGTARALLA